MIGSPDGPPRRRSRALPVVLVAALFGYVLTHRYHAPPTQAVPVPPVPVSTPERADEPHLVGRVGAGPAGLRLLVDGYEPRIVDTHTLSVSPVAGLSLRPGTTAQLLRLGRSRLVALASLHGPGAGVYLVRPGAAPWLLGNAGHAIPSRDGGILLARYGRETTAVVGLSLDRRLVSRWQLPGNVLLLRDTPAGLLVARYAVAGNADLLLVDRRTGGLIRRLGHGRYAVATGDHSLAWVPARCSPSCSVVVTQLSTGASRRYPVYQRPVLTTGAFSPDERWLALSFSGIAGDGAGPLEPGAVVVLDLRTGRRTDVPGVSTPLAEHADVTWSADGRWLVLGVKYPQRERLAIWRPGHEVVILPVVLSGRPTTATLTALA